MKCHAVDNKVQQENLNRSHGSERYHLSTKNCEQKSVNQGSSYICEKKKNNMVFHESTISLKNLNAQFDGASGYNTDRSNCGDNGIFHNMEKTECPF